MAHGKKALCFVVCILSVWRASAGEGVTPRDFVTQDLLTHLANDPVLDWNRIASLSFPLAMRVRRGEWDADRRPLSTVARLLKNVEIESLSCSDTINAALTTGFLADAGVTTAPQEIQSRLAHCQDDSSPFETVNTLLFRCRYEDRIAKDAQGIRTAVARIGALQQTDGSFTFPSLTFLETYYFTSHVLIALYACGMSSMAVWRVQECLQKTLSLFRQAGFLDGLAESLIFLAWTTASPSTWKAHVAFLRARVQSDGGICFVDRPHCLSHWHTTALLTEIESLERSLYKYVPEFVP